MEKILQEIKDQRTATGLRIVDNPWDYGMCGVWNKEGKQEFYGSRITCQLYINDKYREISNEAT